MNFPFPRGTALIVADPIDNIQQRLSEPTRVCGRRSKHMKGQTLRRFLSDAGEFGQLCDELIERIWRHGCETAGRWLGDSRNFNAARDFAQLALHMILACRERSVDRCHEQIFEHGDFIWIDNLRIDLQTFDLLRAAGDHRDEPLARLALDAFGGELLFALLNFFGELVGLPNEVVQIDTGHCRSLSLWFQKMQRLVAKNEGAVSDLLHPIGHRLRATVRLSPSGSREFEYARCFRPGASKSP